MLAAAAMCWDQHRPDQELTYLPVVDRPVYWQGSSFEVLRGREQELGFILSVTQRYHYPMERMTSTALVPWEVVRDGIVPDWATRMVSVLSWRTR